MHLRKQLLQLILAEGPMTALAAARRLGVGLEAVRYYLKAPEYRIIRYEEGPQPRLIGGKLPPPRPKAPRGRVTLLPVWEAVLGSCDCGAPAWFQAHYQTFYTAGVTQQEALGSMLLCHECAKALARAPGVRLAPRWPVAEG